MSIITREVIPTPFGDVQVDGDRLSSDSAMADEAIEWARNADARDHLAMAEVMRLVSPK